MQVQAAAPGTQSVLQGGYEELKAKNTELKGELEGVKARNGCLEGDLQLNHMFQIFAMSLPPKPLLPKF